MRAFVLAALVLLTAAPFASTAAPLGGASAALVVVPVANNQHEFSIAANPLDPQNLVAGGNDYESLDPWAGFFTSFDGGATWTHGSIPVPGTYQWSSEAAVTFDKDGNVYYAGVAYSAWHGLPWQYTASDSALFISKSADGGLTWNTTLVFIVIEEIDGILLDEPSLVADPVTGTLYLTYTQYFGDGGIRISKSLDGGMTWSEPVLIAPGQMSVPALGDDGEIYVTYKSGGGAKFAKSTDGGATWTVTAPLWIIGLGNQVFNWNHLGAYPVMDVARGGPHAGRIYLAAPQPLEAVAGGVAVAGGPSDIVVIHSDDGGASWSEPDRIVRPGEQALPWLAIMPEGTVGIAYMDTILSPWTYTPTNLAATRPHTLLTQSISMKGPDDLVWTTVDLTDKPSFAGESTFWGERQGLAATPDGFHPAFSYAQLDLNKCGCLRQARLDFATTAVAPPAGG